MYFHDKYLNLHKNLIKTWLEELFISREASDEISFSETAKQMWGNILTVDIANTPNDKTLRQILQHNSGPNKELLLFAYYLYCNARQMLHVLAVELAEFFD